MTSRTGGNCFDLRCVSEKNRTNGETNCIQMELMRICTIVDDRIGQRDTPYWYMELILQCQHNRSKAKIMKANTKNNNPITLKGRRKRQTRSHTWAVQSTKM